MANDGRKGCSGWCRPRFPGTASFGNSVFQSPPEDLLKVTQVILGLRNNELLQDFFFFFCEKL